MPQLTVTSNQVDPLTQRWVFFFKCKNMYSLRNEATKYQYSSPSHTIWNIQHSNWWEIPASTKSCYLFAAPSETNRHTLTREELPDGGRLAWPQPGLIAWGQRIQLEWLSKLLNLLQSLSPLPHPQVIILYLCAVLYRAHMVACSVCPLKSKYKFSDILKDSYCNSWYLSIFFCQNSCTFT